MAKKVTIILPAGIAVWPKLDQVDVYQPTDKKGRPNGAEKRRFITRVKYNDEDHRKLDDTVNPYTGFGGGINLYINSVQLLDLKQRDANRFEETEGFTYGGDDEDEADESSTTRRAAVRSASPPPEPA